jgi:threonine dehydratase
VDTIKTTLDDVRQARSVLSRWLQPSPLIHNAWLSEEFGCEIYLKMENMTPIGSFKIRGATYRISQLTEAERKAGVICASAGNHAQGVAWGSRTLGVRARIVMPKSAPLMKVQNTRALGADVILFGDSYDEAYSEARRLQQETGAVFVHAFDDEQVVAGQGTVGLEILDQLPDVDAVVTSIGGGGLMAGMGIALKELRPQVKLYGCQASGSPSMVESLKQGRAVTLDHAETFADGIRVAKASERIRMLLAPRVEKMLVADDEAMAAAVLNLMEKAKIVAEGACGLVLAVLPQIREELRGKKVVLIISGGNIDVNVLSRIIDRGLTLAGRRVRVNVLISDRPGSLARLTDILARQEANILQAIHDRNEPSTRIDQTEVELTLETRGAEHSERVIQALREQCLRVVVLK